VQAGPSQTSSAAPAAFRIRCCGRRAQRGTGVRAFAPERRLHTPNWSMEVLEAQLQRGRAGLHAEVAGCGIREIGSPTTQATSQPWSAKRYDPRRW
jgi:hypothetical protein